jgi:hypothetical protein
MFQASCTKIYKRMRTIKADFHSVQNVARSTFCDHFLLKYKQSNATDQVDWTYFKRKWSQKVDLAIFCTEWKSAWTFLRHATCTHCVPIFINGNILVIWEFVNAWSTHVDEIAHVDALKHAYRWNSALQTYTAQMLNILISVLRVIWTAL